MKRFVTNSLLSDKTPISDEGLSQKLADVSLKSEGDDQMAGSVYPIRPYAEDCSFFLRTGTCKFELNCRFNHPPRANQRPGKEKEIEIEKGNEIMEIDLHAHAQVQCKYFLAPGGCKYGSTCKYRHSIEEYDGEIAELNFLGLPIRPGERECPYYMRNGSCGYGTFCKFHHPDPIGAGGFDPNGGAPWACPMPMGGYAGDMQASGASPPGQGPWPMQGQEAWAYQGGNSAYVPPHYYPGGPSHQGYQNAGWNTYQYQVSNYAPEGNTWYPSSSSVPAVDNNVATEEQAPPIVQQDPSNRVYQGRLRFVLNYNGLPLRPDEERCQSYRRLHVCKYGVVCPFDHPVRRARPKPVAADPEVVDPEAAAEETKG